MSNLRESAIALVSTTAFTVRTATQTAIYTVPVAKRLIISYIIVVCGSAASTTAIISFGQNGAVTDFVGEQTLTNHAAQYDAVIIMPVPHASVPVKTKSYAAGTVIEVDVATADADGATDSTIYLFGLLY